MTDHAFKIFYFKSNLTWRKASLGEREFKFVQRNAQAIFLGEIIMKSDNTLTKFKNLLLHCFHMQSCRSFLIFLAVIYIKEHKNAIINYTSIVLRFLGEINILRGLLINDFIYYLNV